MSTTRSSFLLLGFLSRSAYAAECTIDELSVTEYQSAAIAATACFTSSESSDGIYDCSEDCQNTLEEYANFEFSDCTIGSTGMTLGESVTTGVDQTMELYNTQCETNLGNASKTNVNDSSDTNGGDNNSESSGAHGYSAAHCMLAILVPMAFLFL